MITNLESTEDIVKVVGTVVDLLVTVDTKRLDIYPELSKLKAKLIKLEQQVDDLKNEELTEAFLNVQEVWDRLEDRYMFDALDELRELDHVLDISHKELQTIVDLGVLND